MRQGGSEARQAGCRVGGGGCGGRQRARLPATRKGRLAGGGCKAGGRRRRASPSRHAAQHGVSDVGVGGLAQRQLRDDVIHKLRAGSGGGVGGIGRLAGRSRAASHRVHLHPQRCLNVPSAPACACLWRWRPAGECWPQTRRFRAPSAWGRERRPACTTKGGGWVGTAGRAGGSGLGSSLRAGQGGVELPPFSCRTSKRADRPCNARPAPAARRL